MGYEQAKRVYQALGIDTEKAMTTLQPVPVALHCWQGDDVRGFDTDPTKPLTGGIQTTGNYPGRARTPQELMEDMDMVLKLCPGTKKLNLHASYAIFEDGKWADRDQLEPKHFEPWVRFCKERNLGCDFNPTFFSHPKCDPLTLSSPDPETNLGILRISDDGQSAHLLWGYADGGKFTSEFPSHLMSHMARLEVDPENRVVMHSHPTYTLAMNFVHELDDAKLTHSLWQMCTECIVVFPEGVGVLPWMLCGTNEIGEATAEKMKQFRVVIWGMHGVYGAGKTLDETFGLVETVEKAAQIYMLTAHLPRINTIKNEQMVELAEFFKVNYRKDFLL